MVEQAPRQTFVATFKERVDPEKAIAAIDIALAHIREARSQVIAKLAEHPDNGAVEWAAAALGECLEFASRARTDTHRTLEALMRLPSGNDFLIPTDHPLLRAGIAQRLLRDFNERMTRLVKKKQHEEKAGAAAAAEREERERIRGEFREDEQRREQALHTRSALENTLFGLGVLPGTRARNRSRLAAARETIREVATRDGILAAALARADDAVDRSEIALRRSAEEVAQEEEALRKISDSFFGTFGSETPLDDFKAAIRSAVEKLESFNRELEARMFAPLQLTGADEKRFRSEPIPTETPRFVREARERSFENIRQLIGSFVSYFLRRDKTMEQIAADLGAAVSLAREDPYVGWNERVAEIEDVLKAGEIKPAPLLAEEFASRSATGAAGMYRRREVEQSLGFGRDEYPIYAAYGAARDRDRGPAGSFGAIHLSLPLEKFRFRATCTLGDSLNPFGTPYSMGTLRVPRSATEDASRRNIVLEHAPIARALLDLDEQYEPKRHRTNVNFISELSYVEIQIAGSVRTTDATEIVLSRDFAAGEIDALEKRYSGAGVFSKRLNQMSGRPVRIAGEPHVFDPAALEKFSLYRDSQRRYEAWFAK